MRQTNTHLETFSLFDDVCTCLLVDKVFYWSQIHKVRKLVDRSIERMESCSIINIITKYIIEQTDLDQAAKNILQFRELDPLLRRLSSTSLLAFTRHLKYYLSLYLPSCKFEICSTNQYFSSSKPEACVIARESINAGEDITDLCGTIIKLSPKEERNIGIGKDFSILHSSRLDSMCLFLGPARFVNHDCNANCRFNTSGKRIWLRCVRDIKPGEEITTFYSSNYFGPENCECLCVSCERMGINGFKKLFHTSAASTSCSSKSSSDVSDLSSLSQPNRYVISEEDRSFLNIWDSGGELSDASSSDLDEEFSLFIPRHKKRVWSRERRLLSEMAITNHSPLVNVDDYRKFREDLWKKRHGKRKVYQCSNCSQTFINEDIQNSSAFCPKCIRHSKLFSLPWPCRHKVNRELKLEKEKEINTKRNLVTSSHSMSLRHKKAVDYQS